MNPAVAQTPNLTPTKLNLAKLQAPFGDEELTRASQAWGCNCGPAAIACLLNVGLETVRPWLGNFRGLMNPTEMVNALKRAGVTVAERDRDSLYRPTGEQSKGSFIGAHYGIVRLQWDGPWMARGVPPSASYRFTHWIATVVDHEQDFFAFDCNYGWMNLGEYFKNMDEMAREVPRGTGKWWPTHCYEVSFPGEPVVAGATFR